jgi:hypothetical protein
VAKPCERPSANPFHCREAVALKHYVREVARFMLDHGGEHRRLQFFGHQFSTSN